MRLSYPTSIKIVLVPCTGKIDVHYILKTFSEGADGVMVAGCLEGDCHFMTGNIRAKRRLKRLQALLDEVGVGSQRVAMYNLSSAMGARFAVIANEFNEKIKALGPSPMRGREAHASTPS